ncbi:MAG: LTA synthase family protein [Pseudoxanthomonas sp.]
MVYILISFLACGLAATASWCLFNFEYAAAGTVTSALLLAPFLMLLAPAFRNILAGSAVALVIAFLLIAGHAIKIAAMKTPLQTADIVAFPLLLRTLSGPYLLIGSIALIASLALLLSCIRWRWMTLLPITLAGLYVVLMVLTSNSWLRAAAKALDVPIEDKPAIHAFDLEHRRTEQFNRLSVLGGPLFLLEDWNIQKMDAGHVPSEDEVRKIGFSSWKPSITQPRRNIHIVLLESIWDTSVLEGVNIQGDPIDPRFMALWQAAGKPHALSPVVGGSTANAEFEALCGLPAPSNSIAFISSLKNQMPCLPAQLQKLGYKTIASHPHLATNWARDQAYELIGFQIFNPLDAFSLEPQDMDGPFLTDHSLFDQNFSMLESIDSESPTLNYVVSLSSHWSYARNTKQRPDIVMVEPHLKLLSAYVNSSAYTTRALMDWIEKVLARDPSALIIAFGDHAPVLDAQPDVYRGVAGQVDGQFSDNGVRQLVGMARVPMLILDGVDGPAALSEDTPLYELPEIIGRLVGQQPLLPYSPDTGSTTLVRSVPGRLLARVEGIWRSCGSSASPIKSPECDAAWKIQYRNRTIRQDLSVGKSYYLGQSITRELRSGLTPMRISNTFKACQFDVKQWGPDTAKAGQPFNSSEAGQSAIWISFNKLRGSPSVTIGKTEAKVVQGPRLITASVPSTSIPGTPGEVPVWLTCPDEPRVKIGVVKIN